MLRSIARKTFALLLALVLLAATMPISSVTAASDNDSGTVTSGILDFSVDVDDNTVALTVSANEAVETVCLDLYFEYDKEVFTTEGVKASSAYGDLNCWERDGIYENLVELADWEEAAFTADGELFTLYLTVNDGVDVTDGNNYSISVLSKTCWIDTDWNPHFLEAVEIPITVASSGSEGGDKLTIDPEKTMLNVGESITASATVTGSSTDGVKWNSSDTHVVGIAGSGSEVTLRAFSAGTATITATAGDLSATCEVTVAIPDYIRFSAEVIDGRLALTASIDNNPGTITELSMRFKYDRDLVAFSRKNLNGNNLADKDVVLGEVLEKSNGECNANFTLDNNTGNLTDFYVVCSAEPITGNGTLCTVYLDLDEGVAVGTYSLSLYKGLLDSLGSYAVMDDTKFYIYGAWEDTVTVDFTVPDSFDEDDITAMGYTADYDGEAHTVDVALNGSADGATVTYATSEDGEYTTDAPTFTDVGTYTVYYKVSKDGYNDYTGSATVEIAKATQSISYETTAVSKKTTVEAFMNPLTATLVYGTVSYSSSDTSVATVDENTGVVTIVGTGETTITATAAGSDNYSEATAFYTLTVTEDSSDTPDDDVTLVKSYLSDTRDDDGNWYYYDEYSDGSKKRADFTGFAENKNGWFWVTEGQVTFADNSVIKDSAGAISTAKSWYYVTASGVRFDYTGVANYANEIGWFYIKDGVVDFTANTVAKNKNGWWYVTGGQVQFSYTGVANYKNDYGWWYIKDGQVDFTANTVAKNKNGWWYVTGGQVQFSYTGVANYANEIGWFYIKNGQVDFTANTVARNKNGWWYVTGGQVQFSYTGVANYKNDYGWWYIKDGQVDFTFNGTAANKYGVWNVKGGQVVF